MVRPLLLDLFCGAGGAAMGYYRAGFDVIGVDNRPQPNYPFKFTQGDALNPPVDLSRFDAIHASPPCQGYSRMRHLPWLKGRKWPLLIDAMRELLRASGLPWVIENVADSPLKGISLCGTMFGLRVYRHRKFESPVLLLQPSHPKHIETIGRGDSFNSRSKPNAHGFIGNPGKHKDGARAVGVDWMTGKELQDAIPPAYTEFIGRQLLRHLA